MSIVNGSRPYVAALALVLVGALVASVSGCVTINAPATKPATPAPVTQPATTSSAVNTGDRVAAPWGGGSYIGSVTAVRGDKADVLYDDDKVTREIAISDLIVVVKKTWSVGDKVMAVWSSGKFYPGTVTEAKAGDVYVVKWDDGSSPSDVEAAKIYKP
ncbi:MAG TPA: hypothetical protein VF902_04740 [Coriobacteriia bacterium]